MAKAYVPPSAPAIPAPVVAPYVYMTYVAALESVTFVSWYDGMTTAVACPVILDTRSVRLAPAAGDKPVISLDENAKYTVVAVLYSVAAFQPTTHAPLVLIESVKPPDINEP